MMKRANCRCGLRAAQLRRSPPFLTLLPDDADAAKHKMDLAALKERDPEFYKYLAENDADLLAFDEDEEPSVDGDGATDEDEGAGSVELTMAELRAWQQAMVKVRARAILLGRDRIRLS